MHSSPQMPKGTDETWCEKLYAKCSKSNHFEKPRFGKFAVRVQAAAAFRIANKIYVSNP